MPKCRFNFPFPLRSESSVEINEGKLAFHPKRNHELVNKLNPFIAQVWRANHDLSPVVDKEGVLNYVAKYASKSEKSSTSYVDLLKDLTQDRADETPAKKIFSSFLISTPSDKA